MYLVKINKYYVKIKGIDIYKKKMVLVLFFIRVLLYVIIFIKLIRNRLLFKCFLRLLDMLMLCIVEIIIGNY